MFSNFFGKLLLLATSSSEAFDSNRENLEFPFLKFKNPENDTAYFRSFYRDRIARARFAALVLFCTTALKLPYVWSRATPSYQNLALLVFMSSFCPTLLASIFSMRTPTLNTFRKAQFLWFLAIFLGTLRSIVVSYFCTRDIRIGTFLECPGTKDVISYVCY